MEDESEENSIVEILRGRLQGERNISSFLDDDNSSYAWLTENLNSNVSYQKLLLNSLYNPISSTSTRSKGKPIKSIPKPTLRTTTEINFDSLRYLSEETKTKMFNNRVCMELSQKEEDWCSKNCLDLWYCDGNSVWFVDEDDKNNFISACNVTEIDLNSKRMDYDDFNVIPANKLQDMLRNTVKIINGNFTDDDTKWCEENCSDAWVATNNAIHFLSKDDLTLFLIARS